MNLFKRFEPVVDPTIEILKEAVNKTRAECARSEEELRAALAKRDVIPIASAILWKGRDDA